ncbi:hypothetical protein C8D87_11491 [Lentzea atacamensis]|uniref:Uncharacterized protein n=1 Tax=Lentzea atacamensis TaxID=531938 RepID=A0ABX9DYH2_9PSEU|nr:hypothetical protein [Lentzea atacamensis]RAS59479.1 hypothetical protein C8D87_11491 [Lentzea atacamensis]
MPAATTLAVRTEQRYQAPQPGSGWDWNTLTDLAEAQPDNPVAALLLAAASSVQKLSLHNQISLLLQAGEHQLVLRDIDTEQGWARRGRQPKPDQTGLRVVRPHYQAGQRDGRCVFRTSRRWEFSQTDPLDNHVRTQTAPDVAGDPAEFARHLIDQLGEHCYRVTPGALTEIDHDTRRITIAERIWNHDPQAAVRLLIPALAHTLVADAGRDRDVLAGRRGG